MHLAVDGTPFCYPMAGIGQYVRSLLDSLATERPDWKFTVLAPYAPLEPLSRPNVSHDQVLSRSRSRPSRGWRAWWFDAVLPGAVKRSGADAFWAASGLAPIVRPVAPVALTIFDFTPDRFPETMTASARTYRRWNQHHWIRRARWRLPISHAVAAEARLAFGVEPDAVVTPGVDRIFLEHRQEQVNPPSRSTGYLVVLGTLEPRKNLAALAAAVDRLQEEGSWPDGLVLRMVGGKGWRDSPLRASLGRLEEKGILELTGYLPRAELPSLLAGARALLMPSLYEGFGMPIAEAMAVGCPVVCSDLAPFREIACDRAQFHGTGVDEIVEAYRALLASLPAPGSAPRETRFTWSDSARRFATTLEGPR